MSFLTDYIKEIESNLNALGDFLVEELRNELEGQDKKATGALIESIEYNVVRFVSGLELQISYLKYGRYVETGVSAEQIKYPFAKERIDALMKWIKVKRLTSGLDKDVKPFAFAIAKKHSQVGMPIPPVRFTFNGRNTSFQSFVLQSSGKKIEEKLSDGLDKKVGATLEDIINRITKQFGN